MSTPEVKSVKLIDNLGRLPDHLVTDGSEYGEIEERALPPIQRISGGYLSRNWVMIPHVTHHDDIDITDVETYRKSLEIPEGRAKVSMPVLLAKALVTVLTEFPNLNASLDETATKIRYKKYYNIGIAVDTPNGLLVPVIKNVEQKSVFDIADELKELAGRARTKGLPMDAMMGSSFTISSIGALGGTGFTPLINAPDVAILGATKSTWKATRGENDEVVWRLMLPLSLSYDHRAVNGADAAQALVRLGQVINENI